MVDYEIWDLRNEFNSAEAAYLWLEIEPFEENISDEMKRKKRAMQNVIEERFRIALNMTINKEALRDLAKIVGQRPPFLFPEERKIKKLITGSDPEAEILPESGKKVKDPKKEKVHYSDDFHFIQVGKKYSALRGMKRRLLDYFPSNATLGHWNWQVQRSSKAFVQIRLQKK